MDDFFRRLRFYFRRRQFEAELQEELERLNTDAVVLQSRIAQNVAELLA